MQERFGLTLVACVANIAVGRGLSVCSPTPRKRLLRRLTLETGPCRSLYSDCLSHNKGTKGKTDLIKLDNWGNDFERGDVDEYSIEAMDVGKVLMIQLHNDGGGWWYKNPDWFVNKITVLSSSQDDPFEFPCYRWVLSDLTVFEGKGTHFQSFM